MSSTRPVTRPPRGSTRAPAGRTSGRGRGRLPRGPVIFVVLVLLAVGVLYKWNHTGPARVVQTTCSAGSYRITGEQAENAATIAGVASKLGLPNHAVTIGLATAFQESKMLNLTGGDRDSIGLFQQRPSQGWGTPAELHNPIYATTAFFKRMVEVPGWKTEPVTDVAQAVQRSAAPDAYAAWEGESRAFARAFTGEVAAGLTCQDLHPAKTATVPALAKSELGRGDVSGAHPTATGWALASWLIAHGNRVGLKSVHVNGQDWSAENPKWQVTPGSSADLSYQIVPIS
jgi:hypothetical protein